MACSITETEQEAERRYAERLVTFLNKHLNLMDKCMVDCE